MSTQLDATQIAQVANCNETNPNFPVFGSKKEEDVDGTVAFRTNNSGTSATFSAHPNPADEKINVTINHNSDTEWTLRVLNATGQAVFSQKGQGSNTLDVATKSLQNGLYIIELQAAGERKMNKVIVQH